MARILILSSDLSGRLNALSEVTRRLAAAGHEVTLMSPRDADDLPSPPSGTYESLPSAPEAESQTPNSSRMVALFKRLASARGASQRRDRRVDLLNPEGLVSLIHAQNPDLVLVDIELPVEVMAAHTTGRRLAVVSDMFSLWRRPGLPPLSSDIVPGRGWRGQPWSIELSWLRFRAWKWLNRARMSITRVGMDRRSVLRRVSERTDFPFDSETSTSHWLIPFVYRSIPTIVLNALEIEFPHEPYPNVTYVGPQVSSVSASSEHRPTPLHGDDLDRVLARRLNRESEALIYCSFGAVDKTDRSVLQRVIEAVGDQDGWELVVGLGGRGLPKGQTSFPDNVHLYQWAPQREVLEAADCSVHHGGTHSINESVLAQVPMVLYPDDKLDHKGNAARVAFHRLGVVGDLSSDGPTTIRARISHCLESSEIRSSLSTMAQHLRGYEDRRALETSIGALLEG